jgi:S-adenosyl-L-methionine hydrolase (adenosine-forming)
VARPITFLSDYGYTDPFAGTCRGVIARIAPAVAVIDLSHGVPRHDVERGAAMLANALPYTPAGVHLAVVDPGVGTDRRAIAVLARDEDRVFVGPDNGLLWPALERFGGPVEAVDVGGSPVRLEPVSATFHGRDIFAPVAAHAAAGMSLIAVGERFDPADLVRLERPEPEVGEDGLTAIVSYVDTFGNATLAAAPELAAQVGLEPGAALVVEAGGRTRAATHAITFGDVDEGELVLYVTASGGLALAVNRGSAAAELGIATGDRVVLRPE